MRREPVMIIGTALNIIVIMFGAYILPNWFHVHLTHDQYAALATISTAITALVASLLTEPVNLNVIHTSVATILVAAAAFGLRLSTAEIAQVAAAVIAVLGYLQREKVTPTIGMHR